MAAIAAGACGSATRYTTIVNGGVSTVRGPCIDIGMLADANDVIPVRVGDAACATGEVDEIVAGAAGVYWRIGDAAPTGPMLANAAPIDVPYVKPLEQGTTAPALASTTSVKALGSGEQAKHLASSETSKSLGSGQAKRELTAGEDQRRLQSGETARSTRVTMDTKPVVRLRKKVDTRKLERGSSAEYTLEVENLGDVALASVFVFDRVPTGLAVTGSDGTTVQLADGSTFVYWRRATPVPGKARATFAVRVQLPQR